MGSKYIVPIKLLEINVTPSLPDQFWHKLYYKNGYLKTLKTSEKDVVLDRPLDNFTLGPCLPITAADTVLQAFQKLQCQISVIPPQVNADWNAIAGVQEILNKPILSTVATSGDYSDLLNLPSIPAAQVNSDWNAVSGIAEILNKPVLATVATSGQYSDLLGLPTIVAPVNADWNATSGLAEILNKPTFATVAFTGSYLDLTNTPFIPAAQVNSDWNAVSGIQEILNKPILSTVATTGDYNDLINLPAALLQASALNDGYLAAVDWIMFNNKLDQAYQTVEYNSVALTQRSIINFTGNAVAVSDVSSRTQVAINIPTLYNQQIQNEGSNLTQRNTIDFVGNGVVASDIGGKTVVTISAIRTVQLGVNAASTGASLALLGTVLILNNAGQGGGVLVSTRWQFVVPADFVSGGQVVLDVQRPANVAAASLFAFVNGNASNINATSFNPSAAGVWQTIAIALTTPVVAGDTITVQAQVQVSNGQNLYIRDSYFNYQS